MKTTGVTWCHSQQMASTRLQVRRRRSVDSPAPARVTTVLSRHRESTRTRGWLSVAILSVVYLSFALTTSLLTKAWEGNDEPDHVDYAEFIFQHGSIPRIAPSNGNESQQPPLYYALTAGWQSLLRIPRLSLGFDRGLFTSQYGSGPSIPTLSRAVEFGETKNIRFVYTHNYTSRQHQVAVWLHELRLLSVIFGLGTVLLAYACARIVRLGEAMALSVGLFVALLPKEIAVTSVVTNDPLVIMLCAAALACYLLAERARIEDRFHNRRLAVIGMGVTLGAAAITKFNSLPIAVILLLLVAWPVFRGLFPQNQSDNDHLPKSLRPLVVDLVVSGAAFIAVSGWWFVWNEVHYKSPLATLAAQRNVGRMSGGIYHPSHSYIHSLLNIVPHQLFPSLWYDAAWNLVQMPVWINAVFLALAVLSLTAGAWALLRGRALGRLQGAGLLGCVVAALIACVQVAQSTSHVEGRIAFVGLCAFALIATLGMKAGVGHFSGRAWMGLAVWPAAFLALDVYVLVHFTVPLGGL
jgi:hypothetical protein